MGAQMTKRLGDYHQSISAEFQTSADISDEESARKMTLEEWRDNLAELKEDARRDKEEKP